MYPKIKVDCNKNRQFLLSFCFHPWKRRKKQLCSTEFVRICTEAYFLINSSSISHFAGYKHFHEKYFPSKTAEQITHNTSQERVILWRRNVLPCKIIYIKNLPLFFNCLMHYPSSAPLSKNVVSAFQRLCKLLLPLKIHDEISRRLMMFFHN